MQPIQSTAPLSQTKSMCLCVSKKYPQSCHPELVSGSPQYFLTANSQIFIATDSLIYFNAKAQSFSQSLQRVLATSLSYQNSKE
jgi:hypothetical protein